MLVGLASAARVEHQTSNGFPIVSIFASIADWLPPRIGYGSTKARTEPSAANRGAVRLRLTEEAPDFSWGSTSGNDPSRPPAAWSQLEL